jgi:hypothetical protein
MGKGFGFCGFCAETATEELPPSLLMFFARTDAVESAGRVPPSRRVSGVDLCLIAAAFLRSLAVPDESVLPGNVNRSGGGCVCSTSRGSCVEL